MARPIAPTPKLDAKASRKFEDNIKRGLEKPVGPVPTPRVDQAIKNIMADAARSQK